MGLKVGAFARVWQTEVKSETMTTVRLSISKKNKQTEEYEQEFSGFVAFVGKDCAKKAAQLKEGDRIKLGDVDVTNKYDKDKKVTYTNFKVFGFEKEDGGAAPAKQAKSQKQSDGENEEDGDLPF